VPKDERRDAIEAYKEPVGQTLRCVTSSVLGYYPGTVSPIGAVGTLVFLNETPVPLNKTTLGLHFSQTYDCLQDSFGDQLWKVQTNGYIYAVYERREDEWCEILSYHWHPESKFTFPHIHVKKGEPLIAKAHLPTGRVSILSVVEALIKDFGVEPILSDWAAILEAIRSPDGGRF
jgi:hypothetical protein